MGVIRHKIWRDLWEHKGRTLQVVLIIAIGAFAIGTIHGSAILIEQDISGVWQGSEPAMVGFQTDPAVDEAMIDALADVEGVDQVEGHLITRVKWRLSPEDSWQTTLLAAREYDDQKMNTLTLDDGQWPQRKLMGVERGHDINIGDQIYIEVDDKEYVVPIGGIVYNPQAAPVSFGGGPQLYTTSERFTQLTGDSKFGTIRAVLSHYDPEVATQVADRMQHHLEKQGFEVDAGLEDDERTASPDKHFIQDEVDGVFFILTSLSVISLVLGLFLVYNTIMAVVNQQVAQIGMMKAIGATFWQILGIYFALVLGYAFMALLIAVPLGLVGAHQLRVFLIGLFNMEPGPPQILPNVILLQALVAVLSPLIVAIIPVLSGARV
ncbi:MAG: ABC transporter permease, partial [Chloroflexota bacterium]